MTAAFDLLSIVGAAALMTMGIVIVYVALSEDTEFECNDEDISWIALTAGSLIIGCGFMLFAQTVLL